jgi:hypothetical protein
VCSLLQRAQSGCFRGFDGTVGRPSAFTSEMTSQTAPDWQLQIGESGASSRYNFNMELERLVCKQTALAA